MMSYSDMVLEFSTSVRNCFKKFATFKGRSNRSEFWWFALFIFISQIASLWIDKKLSNTSGHIGPLGSLLLICFAIPFYAVTCRRLHDINKSGWWQIISAVPLIGTVILLFWLVKCGDLDPNRFGAPQGEFNGDSALKTNIGDAGIVSSPIIKNMINRVGEMGIVKTVLISVAIVILLAFVVRGFRGDDSDSDDSPSYAGSSRMQMTTVEYAENKKACYESAKEDNDNCLGGVSSSSEVNACVRAFELARNGCYSIYDSGKVDIIDR